MEDQMDEKIEINILNKSLKNEFKSRDLDLFQVWDANPENIEAENEQLSLLLEWVEMYEKDPNREILEEAGFKYPPVMPGISPDTDWMRFELWMHGGQVKYTLKEKFPDDFIFKNIDEISEDELEEEYDKILEILYIFDVYVEFHEQVPIRLAYEHVLENLDDSFTSLNGGSWHLDGCDGYCPTCFQRPWCEFGLSDYFPEDEKAGIMCLSDVVKPYVVATPFSLEILKKLHEQNKVDLHDEDYLDDFENMNTDIEDDITPF